MLRFKIGDLVNHDSNKGRVSATSGTDGQVIVQYDDGQISKWLDQDKIIAQPKPKVESKPESAPEPAVPTAS